MPSAVETLERQSLIEELVTTEEARKDWIRRAVLEHDRVDVLTTEVLGLTLKPFHRQLQRHCLRHRESQHLAFRGGGKSTVLTVAITIFKILKDPNTRVLIASKTHNFAKDVLKEIKGHLEGNPDLIAIFGEQVGPKWGESEIVVKGRTKVLKEATVSTVGAEGQVIGRHYDVIFVDDLIDERNARTQYMRDQIRTFFYKVLLPTLEPGGELHVVGTRYHHADLYGHFQKNDMKGTTQIVPVLNEKGQTPWPEKFTPEEVKRRRRKMGLAIFATQMQCDAEQMKGEIFEIDYMPEVGAEEIPDDAIYYLGVDPSTGEGKDYFAIVAIAVSGVQVWVVNHYFGKLRFSAQAKKVADWTDEYGPAKVGVETNAYQTVLAQTLEERYPHVPIKKITTRKDKVTRAIKLAARHEEGEYSYVKGNQALMSHLIAIPHGENDDGFDGLDHAHTAAFGRGRRNRRKRGRRTKSVGLL